RRDVRISDGGAGPLDRDRGIAVVPSEGVERALDDEGRLGQLDAGRRENGDRRLSDTLTRLGYVRQRCERELRRARLLRPRHGGANRGGRYRRRALGSRAALG